MLTLSVVEFEVTAVTEITVQQQSSSSGASSRVLSRTQSQDDSGFEPRATSPPPTADNPSGCSGVELDEHERAIQSLDTLSDQIVQLSVRSPLGCLSGCPPANSSSHEALHSSMALMRRLLVDAQNKFRNMMDDNKALASRIDTDLHQAHQEVSQLRAELQDTNSRIADMAAAVVSPQSSSSFSTASEETPRSPTASPVRSSEQPCAQCNNPTVSATPVCEEDRTKGVTPAEEKSKDVDCQDMDQNLSWAAVQDKFCQLQEDNQQLVQHNHNLQKELDELRKAQQESGVRAEEETRRVQTELANAKEALAALKQDRKRLKAEKFDLLNQMKQLYGTLEDKEKELRDFIRNYEQRMHDSDHNFKQLVKEREECEREKWNILKHARDEAERSVQLRMQLGLKDSHIKQLQEHLQQAQEKLGYLSDVESRTSMIRGSNGLHPAGYHCGGYRSPAHNGHGTDQDSCCGPPVPPHFGGSASGSPLQNYKKCSALPGLSRSAEEIYQSSGSSDTSTAPNTTTASRGTPAKQKKRREGKSPWGSISRVFLRNRHRKSLDPNAYEQFSHMQGQDQSQQGVAQQCSWSPQGSLCASPVAEDADKLRLLEEAQGTPMERWKAPTVLAWLEVVLAMPQYGAMCMENIKSGKILLELSDAELEAGLGITNVMHRRKLRLAIEEHREPSVCPYPKMCLVTHTWVAGEWLTSLGLPIYREQFAAQLVDGRVLDTLSRKDLERHLGVVRRAHQVSLLHGVQLLRALRFDRQALAQRRSLCEHIDVDPLVWTNQRFAKWAHSIDLGEYADNLRESGVHGALVVLEPSFTADTMAAALGIPVSKSIIRRHLATELENLVQPARMSLEAEAVVQHKRGSINERKLITATGSLGRSFMRSGRAHSTDRQSDKRRSSIRGSISRALGMSSSLKTVRTSTQREDVFLVGKPPPSPRSSTPQPPHKPPQQHRRVFSYGAIETITVTPV
ncbi:kazrin-like isoform X2 [Ornithodoros turicata]|uniref:kazrin-like isoform X2 n=1 Tax=Ornithodoros turicata TaxID=34597 RepID=UPI003139CC8D